MNASSAADSQASPAVSAASTAPARKSSQVGSSSIFSSSTRASTSKSTPAAPTSAASAAVSSSSQYIAAARSRHSLYGTEDRVVIDFGSRIWKIGFSGEANPRECRSVVTMLAKEQVVLGLKPELWETNLWGLEKNLVEDEIWEIREERLKIGLKKLWFDCLMTNPRTRKVIVLENPLLPLRVKEIICRVLFENLQVASLSFACAPLVSLMATGSVTGLVLDVGNLETTIIPVFAARPLFPLLTSTPRAGAKLNSRLRSFLLLYGKYIPPPINFNSSTQTSPISIPSHVLTEELIEQIKTKCCFVGNALPARESFSAAQEEKVTPMQEEVSLLDNENESTLRRLAQIYSAHSSATTFSFRIPNLSQPAVMSGFGRGWIQIPGWIRERAADFLFERGDEDEFSVAQLVLESLLKLEIDLKKVMISNLIVTGGTANLPGFIPRLKQEILTLLAESHPPTPPTSPEPDSAADDVNTRSKRFAKSNRSKRLSLLRTSPRYASLVPLTNSLAIRNDPSAPPFSASSAAKQQAGQAPAFSPSLVSWVGASLAADLQTGGVELERENWQQALESDSESADAPSRDRAVLANIIPDWTTMKRPRDLL